MESERDDHLRVFSHHPIQTEEAVDGLRGHTDLPEDGALSPEEVAKNELMLIKLARSLPLRIRLEGLEPEEVLRNFEPEQRLAGIAPEELARAISESDRVLSLPEAAQRRIRERLGR